MAKTVKALLLGDIIGQPGCRALFIGLGTLKKEYKADVVIVNGENAADGFGITPETADTFFSSGVDVITTGNHVWQKREILPYLDRQDKILRPANYPKGAAGKGDCLIEIKGQAIGVVNLQGRERMSNIDCPFQAGKDLVRKIGQKTPVIFIDFHAESAEEKEALAYYLDGKVSAVVGTHTHIQTADERILPQGCGYITDLGMSGPLDSVIGVDKHTAIERVLSQVPLKMKVEESAAVIQGVFLEVDPENGKTLSIQRLSKKIGV